MIHIAGELGKDGVQRCRRCGLILTDYRNSMVPEGSPPLGGFAEGIHVEVIAGYPKITQVSDDPATCGRMP